MLLMPARTSVTSEIAIAVAPEVVWRALTQPTGRRSWLADAVVTSVWDVGSAVLIDVVLEGQVRHDRGTVLEAVPNARLSYSLWNEVSRRPDTPETRSIVTFTLAPIDGEGTRLVLVHAGLTAGAAGPHASFFWPVALARLRDELEDRPGRPRIKMVEPNG